MLRRLFIAFVWLAGLALGGVIALVVLLPRSHSVPAASSAAPAPPADQVHAVGPTLAATPPPSIDVAPPPSGAVTPAPPIAVTVDCGAKGFDVAAEANAASLDTLQWQPFHRPEVGWETYAPRIAQEIGVSCGPATPGFAAALSRWQKARRLQPTGRLDVTTFNLMNARWELQRPFVRLSATGVCPAAPAGADLTRMAANEAYGGKAIKLRSEALDAYRRMVAAARKESPAIAADNRLLTVLSGYRTPEDDNARCSKDNDCGNVTRAFCSAHRTGLAVDLVLGGGPVVSSDDPNRLRQSKTAAYAWLVANAGRFGWVNYPFEPWHWEWTGAAQ